MWFVPIRLRISILVAGAVSVSLLSYVFVGTRLIREDKLSYIYDFSLAQVSAAAIRLEQRIDSLRRTGILLASSNDPPPALEPVLRELGASAALLLETSGPGQPLTTRLRSGPNAFRLERRMKALDWNGSSRGERNILVESADEGSLLTVVKIGADPQGSVVLFAALLSIDAGSFGAPSKALDLHLLDRTNRPIRLRDGSARTEGIEAAGQILGNVFSSGVTEIESSNTIAAYHRISGGELTVLGLISKEAAFSAMKTLALRSTLIGVSIVFLTIGMTLAFARGMTRRLKTLWDATRKVSEGDFTVRVRSEKSERISDEISDLSVSFDAMSAKIEGLLRETAEKARMESELETARLVQKRLFPRGPATEGNFRIAGQCLPASECAGDWWHYVRKGDRFYVIIGDVTGHGASAALVAAAAHGAFVTALSGREPIELETLLKAINAAVYSASGGESTMTCFASVVHLKTGRMEMTNASHRPAYLHRRSEENSRLHPLGMADCSALGSSPDLAFVSRETRLRPGDLIIWYTDGLLEVANAGGNTISTARLSRTVAELAGIEANEDPETFCAALIRWARGFWETDDASPIVLEDDVTLVAGIVPLSASFETDGEQSDPFPKSA